MHALWDTAGQAVGLEKDVGSGKTEQTERGLLLCHAHSLCVPRSRLAAARRGALFWAQGRAADVARGSRARPPEKVGGIFRETPTLSSNPNVCLGLWDRCRAARAGWLAALGGSAARLGLTHSAARSQPSQVSLARGEQTLSGDSNAVRSSSFAGKLPCPPPAGAVTSASPAFRSSFPSPALPPEAASWVWGRRPSQQRDGGMDRATGRPRQASLSLQSRELGRGYFW